MAKDSQLGQCARSKVRCKADCPVCFTFRDERLADWTVCDQRFVVERLSSLLHFRMAKDSQTGQCARDQRFVVKQTVQSASHLQDDEVPQTGQSGCPRKVRCKADCPVCLHFRMAKHSQTGQSAISSKGSFVKRTVQSASLQDGETLADWTYNHQSLVCKDCPVCFTSRWQKSQTGLSAITVPTLAKYCPDRASDKLTSNLIQHKLCWKRFSHLRSTHDNQDHRGFILLNSRRRRGAGLGPSPASAHADTGSGQADCDANTGACQTGDASDANAGGRCSGSAKPHCLNRHDNVCGR